MQTPEKLTQCPSCGFKLETVTDECPRCGVIFSKLQEIEIRKDIFANAPPPIPAHPRAKGQTYKRNTVIFLLVTLAAAIISFAAWYTIFSRGSSMYGDYLDKQLKAE